jgi:uncharacterized protein YceK
MSRHRAAAARIVLVLMIAVLLSGCGKKANPAPPPDEPNVYPKNYPHE